MWTFCSFYVRPRLVKKTSYNRNVYRPLAFKIQDQLRIPCDPQSGWDLTYLSFFQAYFTETRIMKCNCPSLSVTNTLGFHRDTSRTQHTNTDVERHKMQANPILLKAPHWSFMSTWETDTPLTAPSSGWGCNATLQHSEIKDICQISRSWGFFFPAAGLLLAVTYSFMILILVKMTLTSLFLFLKIVSCWANPLLCNLTLAHNETQTLIHLISHLINVCLTQTYT